MKVVDCNSSCRSHGCKVHARVLETSGGEKAAGVIERAVGQAQEFSLTLFSCTVAGGEL